jgi:hypothetical protein
MTDTTTPLRRKRATKAEMAQRRAARIEKGDRLYLPGLVLEREREFKARQTRIAASMFSQPSRICAASAKGTYSGADLTAPATRPGADDHMEHPSRRGNTLVYRDGKEVGA